MCCFTLDLSSLAASHPYCYHAGIPSVVNKHGRQADSAATLHPSPYAGMHSTTSKQSPAGLKQLSQLVLVGACVLDLGAAGSTAPPVAFLASMSCMQPSSIRAQELLLGVATHVGKGSEGHLLLVLTGNPSCQDAAGISHLIQAL